MGLHCARWMSPPPLLAHPHLIRSTAQPACLTSTIRLASYDAASGELQSRQSRMCECHRYSILNFASTLVWLARARTQMFSLASYTDATCGKVGSLVDKNFSGYVVF